MGSGSSSAVAMQKKQDAQARERLRKRPPEKQRPVRDQATLFAKEKQENRIVPPQDDIKVKKKKVKVPDPRNARPLLKMPGYVDSKVAAQRKAAEEEVKRKFLEKEELMQGRLMSMGIKKEVIDHVDAEVQARRRQRRKEAHKCRIKKNNRRGSRNDDVLCLALRAAMAYARPASVPAQVASTKEVGRGKGSSRRKDVSVRI